MLNNAKILIIEDDAPIADLLSYGLAMEGYETRTAANGAQGLAELEQFRPDLLLLDWMLPDQSGLDICKKVTATHNLPILMITAKSDITDKVLGLEFGADDYITKPFDLREVVARVRTILRRIGQTEEEPATAEKSEELRVGELWISVREREVTIGNQSLELTPKEFDLLLTLVRRPGQIFTRAELLDLVWGYQFVGDTRTVDTHIQRLRKKLGPDPRIATVFGIGYKFEKTARNES